jgi:hypothetical protein
MDKSIVEVDTGIIARSSFIHWSPCRVDALAAALAALLRFLLEVEYMYRITVAIRWLDVYPLRFCKVLRKSLQKR